MCELSKFPTYSGFVLQLLIEFMCFRSNSIAIFHKPTKKVILEGPLFGKINPSQSMWLLVDDEALSAFRGQKVVLNLEKAHGFQDLWASVFSREFLKKLV